MVEKLKKKTHIAFEFLVELQLIFLSEIYVFFYKISIYDLTQCCTEPFSNASAMPKSPKCQFQMQKQ